MSRTQVLILVLGLTFVMFGCDGSGSGNEAPVITDFRVDPAQPTDQDQVEVTAVVEDPDDNALGYSWMTSAGRLERSEGNPVVLDPDGGAQDYVLRVSVTDGEATVNDSTSFLVRIANPEP